jgi:hypothetical protein
MVNSWMPWPLPGGGQLGELLDGRAVPGLIQAHEQPRVEHPAGLGSGQLLRLVDDDRDQELEQGPQPLRRRGDRGPRQVMANQLQRVDPERLLGAEPRWQAPGRRRDWQAARAALERLIGWGRHRDQRDQRDQPNLERAGRERPGRVGYDLGRQERDGR